MTDDRPTLTPELHALIAELCSEKQQEALLPWMNGAGYRSVGLMLGIAPETARDRIARAFRRLGADPRMKEIASKGGVK